MLTDRRRIMGKAKEGRFWYRPARELFPDSLTRGLRESAVFAGSDDAKDRIRQAVDIVDLVGEQIPLRRQGRIFVGLCPWHDDSRPSLQVNPDRQSWKCWVCDVGGDIFSFVMQREGTDFRQAMEMLADRAGIDLRVQGKRPAAPGTADDKNTLYRAMSWACAQYHACLLQRPEAAPARRYLEQRGIDDESIRRYQLGYAPPEWQWLMNQARAAQFPPEVLRAVGLVARSERTQGWYDTFRGRVMFPICDLQRRPIAAGGRILPELAKDEPAKYINSPETRLFSKSEQLYGLHLVRDCVARHREVIVMEGYTDVVIARQFGIENAVAVLGTALGPRHIQLLKRYADRITLLLDGDEAGKRRANEVLELFIANQVDLRIVTLPGGLDPCDFLLQQGRKALLELIAAAPDAWEYKIQTELAGIDPMRDTHQANQALERLLQTFSRAPVGTLTSSGSQRLREQQILNRLAREFRLDEQHLRQRLDEQRHRPTGGRVRAGSAPPSDARSKPVLEPMERDLFELLLLHPDAVSTVLESIGPAHLDTPSARHLLALFSATVDAGVVPEFQQLLLATDDPAYKNLLVELDEAASRKSKVDSTEALRELLRTYTRRYAQKQLQRQQASLESDNLTEQQQMEMLLQILRTKQELIDN